MRMNCWLWARPSRRFLPRTKSNGTSRQKSKRRCGARIAAAAFAIDADVAVLAGSHKSPVAMSHLAEAKSRADRSIRQWSRRVLRSVAQQANAFRRNAGPLYEAPSRSPECELPTSSEYQRLDPVSVGVKPRSRKVTRPRRVIPNRTCEESGGGPPPPYLGTSTGSRLSSSGTCRAATPCTRDMGAVSFVQLARGKRSLRPYQQLQRNRETAIRAKYRDRGDSFEVWA